MFTGSDFDDIYDRMFLRVSSSPSHLSCPVPPLSPCLPLSPLPFSLMVYRATRRSSPRKDSYGYHDPSASMRQGELAVMLQFGPRGALGSANFLNLPSGTERGEKGLDVVARETMQMGQWLKKTSIFGGTLSRKFKASNGEEYRWMYRSVESQEWSVCKALPISSPWLIDISLSAH